MITNKTRIIENDDKRELFIQSWSFKETTSKENLLIVHGLGEHSDSYKDLAEILAPNLNVFAFDFSGHGRSSGQRGYVGDINWLISDLTSVIDELNKPIHIFAHSLGGLITVSALQNQSIKNIKSLILSNPCLGLNVAVPKWKRIGADLLTKSLPRVTLGNEISPRDLSTDLIYLENFKKDPLRHKKISPRLYLGMLDLIEALNPEIFPSDIKCLLLLSQKDPICNPVKAETYFNSSENKQIHFFNESMHEILNDLEKNTAHKLIKEFLC